jgi:threonine/homoserine efflux transporter RhtA
MDLRSEAHREVALDIRKLAEEFERSDELAFQRSRMVCWVVVAVLTVAVLFLLLVGADWRYLGAFWIVIVGLSWSAYWISARRQRQQTSLLRNLADRWMHDRPAA